MSNFDTQNPRFATIKSTSFNGQTIPCLFGETKGRHLTVQAKSAVNSSTTVTVEYEDSLFLGEVITCKQDEAVFVLDIKVEQILSGLRSLMALRATLLGETPASAPRVAPINVSHLTQAVA